MADKRILILGILLVGLVASSTVLAQTSPSYNLEWYVIGGGGQPAASAHYAVSSTTGQAAAGPPYPASAHYVVSGGYWFVERYATYLPLILR
jgi:hypothetical protein